MRCATKNALFSVILWLLTLIGIAPVTTDWVDTVEQWISHEQALQPAIHIYASAEGIDFRAFVFVTGEVDATHPQPAVVTAFRASATQAELDSIYGVCSDLAELGYVAIAFELRSGQEDVSGVDETTDTHRAGTWLAENADELGVDISRTVLIAMEDQPLLGFGLNQDPKTEDSTVENGCLVIPAGLTHFPDELIPFLPALP